MKLTIDNLPQDIPADQRWVSCYFNSRTMQSMFIDALKVAVPDALYYHDPHYDHTLRVYVHKDQTKLVRNLRLVYNA